MKKLLAGAAVAAALGMAGSASAAVLYNLDYDACSGGCGQTSYGTVSVSGQNTNTLTVTISLNANTIFQQAGGGRNGHDEIWFNTQNSSETLGGLASPFVSNGAQTAGSHQANGNSLGLWDYLIDYVPGAGNPATAAGGAHSLTFTITGGNPVLQSDLVGGKNLFFVVDVASFNPNGGSLINTGRVAATLAPSVPEPATWAMMLMGFFGAGAMLRRRRTAAAVA